MAMERLHLLFLFPASCLILLAGCKKDAALPVGQQGISTTNTGTNIGIRLVQKWFQNASPTYNGRVYGIGFSIGAKGYVGGGQFGLPGQAQVSLNDFWEYDPTTNTWAQKSSMPIPLQEAASFVVGTQGYVCTGVENTQTATLISNFLYQYDQASNTWTRKADFPGGARRGAVGVGVGVSNVGYVGTGGMSPSYNGLNDWWQYYPVTDQWTQKASLPGSARIYASGFSIGGSGYITCGAASIGSYGSSYNDLWMYVPKFDSWTREADLPAVSRESAVGFSYGTTEGALAGGRIISGPQTNTALNDFWHYTQSTNQWTQDLNMAGGGRFGAVGYSINGIPYVGTGLNYQSASWYLNDFWDLSYTIL
jgi:N-acetylneuraminic acid mutarotase